MIFDPNLTQAQIMQRAVAVLGQEAIDDAKANRPRALDYMMRNPERIQDTINQLVRLQKQSFHEASRFARSLPPDLKRAIACMWISKPNPGSFRQ